MLKERTKAGLDAAREQRRIGGRRPKLSDRQQSEIRMMVTTGDKTAAADARLSRFTPQPSRGYWRSQVRGRSTAPNSGQTSTPNILQSDRKRGKADGPAYRSHEAFAEQRQAMELDPLSLQIAVGQPFLFYLQGRYDLAIEGFRTSAAAHPLDPAPQLGIGMSQMEKGDYAPAIEIFSGMLRQRSNPVLLGFIGYTHARAGHLAEARKILDRLTAQSNTRPVPPACFGLVYTGLNDRYRASSRSAQTLAAISSSPIFA